MRFVVFAVGLLWAAGLDAQTVRFRADAIAVTYQEISGARDAVGAGGGGGIELRFGKFHIDARAHSVMIDPDSAGLTNYDLAQVDVRGAYRLTEYLSLEVGGGRRYVTPEFSAQGVGYTRFGVYSENALNRLASVWVRGAFLPNPRFSGGGDADLAFEFSLGAGIGTANGRFRFQAEFEFQRIDRRAIIGFAKSRQVALLPRKERHSRKSGLIKPRTARANTIITSGRVIHSQP